MWEPAAAPLPSLSPANCLAASITAIDLSPEALAIAAENAGRHGAAERIAFLQADLADLPGDGYDLLVANPPYIPADEVLGLMPEVRDFEPHLALNGGADGLDAIRQLVRQAPQKLRAGGWLLTEIGVSQVAVVKELFLHTRLMDVFVRDDYAGIPRVVGGRKP